MNDLYTITATNTDAKTGVTTHEFAFPFKDRESYLKWRTRYRTISNELAAEQRARKAHIAEAFRAGGHPWKEQTQLGFAAEGATTLYEARRASRIEAASQANADRNLQDRVDHVNTVMRTEELQKVA